jgi:molybdate transport system ATP-binding protein
LRVQLLARDVIVATQLPQHLSVRNHLQGVVSAIDSDADSDLVSIDVGAERAAGDGPFGGGPTVLARITKAATRDLNLVPGTPVWALVKSMSLRGLTSPAIPRE